MDGYIISDEVDLLKVIACSTFVQSANSSTLKIEIDKNPVFLDDVSLTTGLLISPKVLEQFRKESVKCPNKRELMAKTLFYAPQSPSTEKRDLLSKMLTPGIEASTYTYGINYLLGVHPAFTKDENTEKYVSGLIKLSDEARDLLFEFTGWLESESSKGAPCLQ